MKVVKKFPPNYEKIAAVFDIKGKPVVFAYGESLFVGPNGVTAIPDHLMVHESTHSRQHAAYPGGVEAWWERYLIDGAFRLSQEVEAYRNQYRFVTENYARPQRKAILKYITHDLSSEIYGNLVSFEEAHKLITS